MRKTIVLLIVLVLVASLLPVSVSAQGNTCTLTAVRREGTSNWVDFTLTGPDGEYFVNIGAHVSPIYVSVSGGSASFDSAFPYADNFVNTFPVSVTGAVECATDVVLDLRPEEGGPSATPAAEYDLESCEAAVYQDVGEPNILYFQIGGLPEGSYDLLIDWPDSLAQGETPADVTLGMHSPGSGLPASTWSGACPISGMQRPPTWSPWCSNRRVRSSSRSLTPFREIMWWLRKACPNLDSASLFALMGKCWWRQMPPTRSP